SAVPPPPSDSAAPSCGSVLPPPSRWGLDASASAAASEGTTGSGAQALTKISAARADSRRVAMPPWCPPPAPTSTGLPERPSARAPWPGRTRSVGQGMAPGYPAAVVHRPLVLILDYGSQYTQLIARRIREQHVYCEIHPCTLSLEEVRAKEPLALILSGGPASV